MAFKFAVKGDAELARALEDAKRILSARQVKPVLMDAGKHLQWQARRNVPTGPGHFVLDKLAGKSLHLRDSIFCGPGKPDAPDVIVGVDYKRAPQAFWLEFGTVPHVIYSKTKRGLFIPAYQKWIPFARHPGLKKRPWFRPAINSSKATMFQIIATGCSKLLGRWQPMQGPDLRPETTGWIG